MRPPEWSRPRKLLVAAAGVLGLASVAALGFAITYSSQAPAPAEAQEEPEREPFWYVPLFEDEAERPRLDTTIAGIRLGPGQERQASCEAIGRSGEVPQAHDLSIADASELRIRPSYLPPGAAASENPHLTGAVTCDGIVVTTLVRYYLEQRSETPYAGSIWIERVRGQRSAEVDVAADRAEPIEVGGRPAILIHPLTDDGIGDSYVLIAEPWGLTIVRTMGLSAEDLLRVAEGL